MELLPKELWTAELAEDKYHVIVSAYEQPKGYRYYHRFCLSDFPNHLLSLDDLKNFGIISSIDVKTVKEKLRFPFPRKEDLKDIIS